MHEPILTYENEGVNELGLRNVAGVTVLGNSFVKYVDHLGSDEFIVNKGARLSYRGESKGPEKDKGLLRYLFKNKHTSPFEQVNITFQIRMPIFIMRQFVRHRTFRLNEVSARYGKLDLGFYVPDVWRAQAVKGNRQGSVASTELNQAMLDSWLKINNDCSFNVYEDMLNAGVANEMARMVLPLNALTEIIVNIDMNNLLKYFMLRDDNHAQVEHVEIAQAMKLIAKDRYPWVIEMYEEIRARMTRDTALKSDVNLIVTEARTFLDNEQNISTDGYTGLVACFDSLLARAA